ncbi:MAG: IreB family regulatory phosphoprotein [Clostridiales bacterium]|jgi:uncharacterized protein (UPF0297 family)|nr:IreB family regulatory phosphoprotein [Clostridiales bacterium]
MDEQNTTDTMQFEIPKDRRTANEIIMTVFSAMREKGYDPVNQIVGYLLSGDPTYITSYNNARYLVRRIDRDELIEELVRFYVENNVAEA